MKLLLLPILALALCATTAGTIWGCASSCPDIGSPDPSTFKIRLHVSGSNVGRVDSPIWNDDELALLREWMDSLGKGGSVSFNTFAPALVISSGTFDANFLSDGTLVLNARSANGNNWIQRIRTQTPLDAAVGRLAREKAATQSPAASGPAEEPHAENAENAEPEALAEPAAVDSHAESAE